MREEALFFSSRRQTTGQGRTALLPKARSRLGAPGGVAILGLGWGTRGPGPGMSNSLHLTDTEA